MQVVSLGQWPCLPLGASVVYASKVEADEAIAVASVISIGRTEYMGAGKVIGLEYLEHERQTWLWRWGGVGGMGGGEGGGRCVAMTAATVAAVARARLEMVPLTYLMMLALG